MLEKCLKCNTSFEVDESLITSKLKFFKCSVCGNEWPFVNNKTLKNHQKIYLKKNYLKTLTLSGQRLRRKQTYLVKK